MKLSISIKHKHCTVILLLWRYCKIRISFKTLVSKKMTIWRLRKSRSNDKLLEKRTSSNYHMEQKTFIEASYIYNIHTGENIFLQLLLLKFVRRFDWDRLKNFKGIWSVRVFFYFYRDEKTN